MKRRAQAVRASALNAPLMTLAEAVERLPHEKEAFNKVRYRWIDVVRGHPLLTAGQRHVGLAIAQKHINQNPKNAWFRSAWAGHRRIADEIGLTRRTVVTAMGALSQIGLIAIEHGGGLSVPGGRTDRYTLRIDRLDILEHAAEIWRKDVKNNHRFDPEINLDRFGESCEKVAESGEIDRQIVGNLSTEGVKQLPTTLSNSIPLESSFTTIDLLPDASRYAAVKQASKGSEKKASASLTAQDHHELALLVGDGDLERGYGRLDGIADANIDKLALRYRSDRSSGQSIRVEVVELTSTIGSRI